MMFLDRLTGRQLSELPTEILPGRYRLLDSFLLNDHSNLGVGDLLLDDGSGVIQIGGEDRKVLPVEHSDKGQADCELSVEAIVTIAEKIALAGSSQVSPMLPAEMAAQCELDDLEKNLADVLRNGHLHSISDSPKRDLRYEDLVVPVARVRRLATTALSHLASHSDCWQQRTLSGVQPRKILARFSEDDCAIYENRLYKRLLDRLDQRIAKKLARIRGVNLRLERALNFQNSEQAYFRLREDICRIWGESYRDDKTGMQLEAGKRAIDELEALLRAVRGLRQRGLYKLLPVASSVPDQVHRTNILSHDPHYRHLPSLWEKLKDDREERLLLPKERLAQQQKLQCDYVSYIGLVIRRALERYKLKPVDGGSTFVWADRTFVLKLDEHDWILTQTEGSTLRIIPIAWFGSSIESGESLEPGRVVCWPGAPTSVESPRHLLISPLDLYVVERMGRLIDEWMLRKLLQEYGRKLGPLPTLTKKFIESWPEFESISSTHVRLRKPLNDHKSAELKASLKSSSANKQTEREVVSAIAQFSALAQLCGCGQDAQFSPLEQQGFYCLCESCKTVWMLKMVENRRCFSMGQKEAYSRSKINSFDSFAWYGRHWLEFKLE